VNSDGNDDDEGCSAVVMNAASVSNYNINKVSIQTTKQPNVHHHHGNLIRRQLTILTGANNVKI